jgi:hypothetical protein
VEFLGEEDMGHGSITYEELHFESPYLLMFMEDVSQDSAIRVCADQSCKRLFEPKRGDQMYCNQTCAGRTSSRNYRKRQSKPPGE